MTREEVSTLALSSIDDFNCTILECSTGFGKSKLAIDMANKLCDKVWELERDETTILLLVAKSVHKQTWKDEIEKWGGLNTDKIVIECYESLKKYKGAYFDLVILDEAHHIQSETRLALLQSLNIQYHTICLSATIPKDLKRWFKYNRKFRTNIISCDLQQAINDDVLPEPKIYLIPLEFDDRMTETICFNVKKDTNPKDIINVSWTERWTYKKSGIPCRVYCTKRQYLDELNSLIEWYKNKGIKTKQLLLCSNRLKWLSNLKNVFLLTLLNKFKNERTLTFCNSIDQTEILGRYCINSKNHSQSTRNLNKFNQRRIKHITSCNMLNESVNLTNCRIGIFANLNASSIIQKQRMGRLLRHPKPIIIIPYYKNTREEEILKKMLSEYNKELINTVTSLDDIEL